MAEKARLSFNQITLGKWSVSQAVEGCVRHGIPSIALWRHKIAETGLASCVRLLQDAGLHVSSVCRGGMFPSPTQAGREKSLEDNYRAVDEAAALRADSLVLVVGASPEVPIADARKMVADGVAGGWPIHGVASITSFNIVETHA
jgi:sugar phosphate isomerase/epimerase